MNIVFILSEILILILGIMLCFRGITWYKLLQVLSSAYIFGYIGILIWQLISEKKLIYIIPILSIIGGILSYKFYEISLRISFGLITFNLIVHYYWNMAKGMYVEASENVSHTRELLLSVSEIDSLDKAIQIYDDFTKIRFQETKELFLNASSIMKSGIGVAVVAAIIVGIFIAKIHNYIIIVITAVLGATYIAGVLMDFVNISSLLHYFVLVLFILAGILYQLKIQKPIKKKK